MYKRVSTALQSTAFRLLLSSFALAWISVSLYGHWPALADAASSNLALLLWGMLLVIPLAILNLFCESKKWIVLLGARDLSIRQAFLQVLSGMCSAFVTPNRIGDVAGRMTLLPRAYHKHAAGSAIAGSILQVSLTAFFGCLGLLLFPLWPEGVFAFEHLYPALVGISLAFALLFALRRPFKAYVNALLRHFGYLFSLPLPSIRSAFLWALARYAIFSTQFVLLLFLLGFTGSWWQAYAGVCLLFACQSMVPGAAFGELGVREVLAVFFFGAFLPHPLMAIVAGLLLWMSNIALPVLCGVGVLGLSLHHD